MYYLVRDETETRRWYESRPRRRRSNPHSCRIAEVLIELKRLTLPAPSIQTSGFYYCYARYGRRSESKTIRSSQKTFDCFTAYQLPQWYVGNIRSTSIPSTPSSDTATERCINKYRSPSTLRCQLQQPGYSCWPVQISAMRQYATFHFTATFSS